MQTVMRITVENGVDRERYRRIILSAEQKLDELQIKYGNIVLWEINTRAKKRFGQCRLVRKGCYAIDIAAVLFEAEDKYIEEVILHELLHSCEGCMSHGQQWKRYAAMVNTRYDCQISTTGSHAKYGLECSGDVQDKQYKYLFQCRKCGRKQGYYKRGKVVKILQGDRKLKGYVQCVCGCGEFDEIVG